jgi:hypothetical protein
LTFILGFPFSSNRSLFIHNETLTGLIKTRTSINGPITAAKAWPEFIPNTPVATAIANSKLLLAAVNESVAVSEYKNSKDQERRKDTPNMMAASKIIRWKYVLTYALVAWLGSVTFGMAYGLAIGGL